MRLREKPGGQDGKNGQPVVGARRDLKKGKKNAGGKLTNVPRGPKRTKDSEVEVTREVVEE